MNNPSAHAPFSWQDPMIGAKAAQTMSGLAYLQAMGRGELPIPPIMAMMNIDGIEAEAGKVTFSITPAEYHYNPIGVVHGGLAATLCDSAMACAIHSTLPVGDG